MKKQAIMLFSALILLAGFVAAYMLIPEGGNSAEEQQTPGSSAEYIFYEDAATALTFVVSKKGDVGVNLIKKNDAWISAEYPDLPVVNSSVMTTVSSFSYLIANEVLTEKTEDLSQYGLDNPNRVEVEYTNAKKTLLIGNLTIDGENYYVKAEDSDKIYLLAKSEAERIMRSYNELINKGFTVINITDATYLYINDKTGLYEIEASRADELATSVDTTLLMSKPFEGERIQISYFGESVYLSLKSLKMEGIANLELNDEIMKKYGLDDPQLHITVKDDEGNVFELKMGNDAGNGYAYCILDTTKCVFLVDKSLLNAFRNINVFTHMEKFVSLHYIEDIETVRITYMGEEFILAPGYEGTGDETVMNPSVSGIAVDETTFKDIYQGVVGFLINMPVSGFEPLGEPELTVEFTYVNKRQPNVLTNYYPYDDANYAIEKHGEPVRFAMSRKYADAVISKLRAVVASQ